MNKKSKPNLNHKSRLKWIIVCAIFTVLYGITLFTPLISPFTRYPLYIIKCRRLPIVATNFAAGYTYRAPGDENYGVRVFDNFMFCNEEEAKKAGFRRISETVRYN